MSWHQLATVRESYCAHTKQAMSQSTRAVPKPTGDRCAFPRNLTRGAYGGDVNCLQQYLRHTVRTTPQRT